MKLFKFKKTHVMPLNEAESLQARKDREWRERRWQRIREVNYGLIVDRSDRVQYREPDTCAYPMPQPKLSSK